jgi:cation transport ATPase
MIFITSAILHWDYGLSKGGFMTESWEREYGRIKTIVFVIYLAMIVYAFLVFSGIPSVQYQWEQTQKITLLVLLAEAISIFVISIFLSNILLSSEKLSQKFRSVTDQTQGLKLVVSQVRIGFIVMAALGEACAVNGLILYLLSGDATRPWIFFILTLVHYTITMAKLRRVHEDVGQMSG